MSIKKYNVKSNGCFSIIREPYDREQHPNQQCGLDRYIGVLDHNTGIINSVKLYENKKGLHFKKKGSWYLSDFTQNYLYIPFQIMEAVDQDECEWDGGEEGVYNTGCGRGYYIDLCDGSLSDQKIKFCPFCGKPISEIRDD